MNYRAGLIGYTGFVGGTLMRQHAFDGLFNSANIASIRGAHFDLLVIAAPQAKKWWSNQNPELDLQMTQALMAELATVTADRVVLISTVDVFPRVADVDERFDCASQPNHAYGRHRLLVEREVAARFAKANIVRLPALFGHGLRKNVLYDLQHDNQLEKVHPDSRFQWYDMSRLWADIGRVVAEEIPLVVFATEPLETEAIRARFFPGRQIGGEGGAAAFYDVHSCRVDRIGGKGFYLMDRGEVLDRIGLYLGGEASGLEAAGKDAKA